MHAPLATSISEPLFDVFWVLALVGAAVGWALLKRAKRLNASGRVRGVRTGPLFGYSFVPGPVIRWDPGEPLPAGFGTCWRAGAMETLPAGRRARVVITIEAEEMVSTDRFSLMKALAHRIQRRTGAGVVAVELRCPDDESHLVYCPDGRGWTGGAREAQITASLPGKAPFRMGG